MGIDRAAKSAHNASIAGRWETRIRTSCQGDAISVHAAMDRRFEDQQVQRARRGASENNRRARYYTLTRDGKKRLAIEREQFETMIGAIQKVLA